MANRADPIRSVDRFLETELEARALALAFSLGLVDRLAGEGAVAHTEFLAMTGLPEAASGLFMQLLAGNDVIRAGDTVRLSPAFRAALAYRDLLEARLWFLNLVAPDIHGLFPELLGDVPEFMARAKVFDLFRYDRCMDVTPANLAATARWVDYTTTLTRYEAPACLDRLDLDGSRRLVDVGGNSGEFAHQACARFAGLDATVFDLPVVCALGRRHVAASTSAGRVSFHDGDLRADPLPAGHDVISFKSVLHDWPPEHAAAFLGKAAMALEPGGRLIIFERVPLDLRGASPVYSMVADLVFLPFFRSPDFYVKHLAELGFVGISVERVELDTPFALVTARKP